MHERNDWTRELRDRLAPLRLHPEDEAELVEELTQHFDQEWTDACRVSGADEATRRIRAEIAGSDFRELANRRRTASTVPATGAPTRGRGHWLADLRDDLRFGLRTCRRAPAFAAVAIATLGLGIGATTAVYSVVDAVLVRSLPFAQPDRLVRLRPERAGGRVNLSVADFFAVRDRVRSFESIATYGTFDEGLTFTTGDQPERVYGAAVSGDFFATLGVPPMRGRTFTRDDEVADAPAKIVLSYDFWQHRLGGAADIVGRTIEVQGAKVPVIGVMPPGFWFPRGDRAEFWMNNRLDTPTCECAFTKRVIARLAPSASPRSVQASLDLAAVDVRTRFPGGPPNWTFVAEPLRDTMVAGVRPVLLMLLGAVTFVLLIACVNVINLLLARATARQSELSVRVALGASRGRLARQLFAETSIFAIAGGLISLVIARWTVAAIVAAVPSSTPMLHDVPIGLDVHALLVALGCVLFCTAVAGVVPAMVVARRDVQRSISALSQTHGSRRSAVRDSLVIAEIALALMLVVGAGLMVRSLAKLRAVDTGIRSGGVMTASISLPRTRYDGSRRILDFTDRTLAALASVPEVSHVALSDGLPPSGVGDQQNFLVEGSAVAPDRWEPVADHLLVSEGYFATLGIPLRSGRLFDSRDRDTAAAPAIISEALAKRFFAGSPLGRRMRLSGNRWVTVVGVVGDAAYEGLASKVRLAVYEPFAVLPQWSFSVIARSEGDPYATVAPLRRIVGSLDRGVAVAQIRTIDEMMDSASAANRFRALLLGVLAGLALVLASIGVYGLISFTAAARTKELGIRIALGARRGQIIWIVMRQAVVRALIGVGIGVIGALLLSRWLTAMLFGVTPTDPVTFGAVSVLLVAVAAGAALVPARRVSRADPIRVLRSD